MIVGFAGKKGCGKSTAADVLVDIGWEPISFASTLKKMARVLLMDLGISATEFAEANDDKESVMPTLGCSYRHLLQTLGIEWGRQMIRNDLWLRTAQVRMATLGGQYDVVIDDVRFDDEADLIRSLGGVIIHLDRHLPSVDGHVSESGVTVRAHDVVYDNTGSVDDLVTFVIAELDRIECHG